ncbi:MAG: DEAD/DEAH box helicase family protein, partial [Desulfosporosinus sp.]
MTFEELLEKYQALLLENGSLKEEITNLNTRLGVSEHWAIHDGRSDNVFVDSLFPTPNTFAKVSNHGSEGETLESNVNGQSDPKEKIMLFKSLFKGRDDVYAKRYENKKKGTNGYSPFCLNEWKSKLCIKPKGKCAACSNKAYARLDEKVIDDHLRGRGNFVAGIYPLCLDETCYFLAIDFDDGEWQKDISQFREVCSEFDLSVAIERSRSGNGAHAWIFFESPIAATLARKLGSALLTYAMNKRHEITFKSYDRFFPNQDTMPRGGLGNLIALPLQKAARSKNNSVFIDANFEPFNDQWEFMATIQKLSEDDVTMLISKLCNGNELGILKRDAQEEPQKPWETINTVKLSEDDFSQTIKIVKANMLFILKTGISHRALNLIKRLAAFNNPEFYKAQAMRMPIYKKKIPRIISCSDETADYLCLPRGCEADLKAFFAELKIESEIIDETNHGRSIDVEFNGSLREEQPQALDKLLEHDIGVLSGTTAFGKTVVAINLIAARKVNTLIIVDKVNLATQWKNRITELLTINEALPDRVEDNKRRRKKANCTIGQLGAGKDNLSGIIDIAVMQSLNRMGEVKDCVKNYGMIIVDECHHISAFSFETILKSSNAKYVYGLTATPIRKDGHHPIIFMQCGSIRFKDDAKKQAEKRPFEHYVIPRFTSLRVPLDKNEKDVSIQELYSEIVVNEFRNQLITNDIVRSFESGRNCLVLTERTAHVELLAKKLSERIPEVISLTGGMGVKRTREIMTQISETHADKPLTLVATGKYIGEGFDEPRLDTLFLVMPISWKGTLQQYAGRLHRLFANKKEVQIYDYVDIHVRMLERMYHKRLNGYATIGYKAKGESSAPELINVIFDKSNFLSVYTNDIINAAREILIVSPFVTKRRTLQMMQHLKIALENKVKVIVITRPLGDFKDKNTSALQGALDVLKVAG